MYLTCNPGGVGHAWVKRLFIDRTYINEEREEDYEFIPSKVYENDWLMKNDPSYIRTLENLPEERRKAMLDGNWDVYDGQFFDEFNREIHITDPHKLPTTFRLYRVLDYGLDMLACYHVMVDTQNNIKIIHEIYESNLIVQEAALKIKETTKSLGFSEDDVYLTLAPDDLWSRDATIGKSAFDIFYDNGLTLTKSSRARIDGWLAVKELMKVYETRDPLTGNMIKKARLQIFSTCRNLIRCIPLLQYDSKKYNDVSTEPHEITHGPDALRYFAIYWVSSPTVDPAPRQKRMSWTQDMLDDYYNGDIRVKERMLEVYGEI